MNRDRSIAAAGIIAWLAIGAPIVFRGANSRAVLIGWIVAFAAFGVAFAISMRARFRGGRRTLSRRWSLAALGAQSLAVAAMVLLLCHGLEGTLLVLVAMQLPDVLDRRRALVYLAVQSLLLAGALAIHWTPGAALMIVPPYFGFQLLALFTFEAMAGETNAKEELARRNAELSALHEILAETSRATERMRLKAELHDTLGHHLTALALNLEVALQQTEGAAREKVEAARSIVKALLGDVRELVGAMNSGPGIDLGAALSQLVCELPRPQVHLEVAPDTGVADPERAHVVVRCTQEIVTNAAKHSGAENLWIVVERDGDSVRIRAHDDGRGREEVTFGFGLRAMRERIERAGGELSVATRPGFGFDVVASLPKRSRPE